MGSDRGTGKSFLKSYKKEMQSYATDNTDFNNICHKNSFGTPVGTKAKNVVFIRSKIVFVIACWMNIFPWGGCYMREIDSLLDSTKNQTIPSYGSENR